MIQSFLGALLGGVISGFINWLLYKYKEIEEARKRHFEEIKKNCIEPIIENINSTMREFNVTESTYFDYYLDVRQDGSGWWNYFTFRRSVKDELLYEDLRNHFKRLYEELEYIEKHIIKEALPRYISLMGELVSIVKDEISRELPKLPPEISDKDVLVATVMIAFGYDRGSWPNIYKKLREYDLLDKIKLIASNIRKHKYVQELLKIRREALLKLDSIRKHALEILHLQKLKGKCPYCEG